MSTLFPDDLETGFQRLLTAAKDCPPRPRLLIPSAGVSDSAQPGEIWVAAAGQSGAKSAEVLVLVVSDTGIDSRLGHVWRVAPVFDEIELASCEDAILPSRVLGWEAGIALGCESAIARDSLKRCVGRLPEEWRCRIDAFRYRLKEKSAPFPAGILTGRPFADECDPGFVFHQALMRRMSELMAPATHESHAPATVPLARISEWMREEWQNWVAAARQMGYAVQDSTHDMLAWARGRLASLDFPTLAPAGFRADDGRRAVGVLIAEFRVEDSGALFHVVREIPTKAELMLQVLEDPSGILDGAEIVNVDGGVLARVQNGLSSHPFEVTDGCLLVRLATGSLASLSRVEA